MFLGNYEANLRRFLMRHQISDEKTLFIRCKIVKEQKWPFDKCRVKTTKKLILAKLQESGGNGNAG